MTPAVRLPAGPITPHGAYHFLRDRIPTVKLRAYDDSIVFALMGGEAIADRQLPERVELKDIKGLVPPWQTIDAKGATEDGVTFIDALYDPIEVELECVAVGRDPAWARKVTNWLFGSIDAKQTAELSWITHEMGRWWAPVRWFKTPDNPFRLTRRQAHTLRLRADSGFWQSYPNVDQFTFAYESVTDEFDTDYETGGTGTLGPNWPQYYYGGNGGGYCYARAGQARWKDDPDDTYTTLSRAVVNGPYAGFSTAGDTQVISTTFGSFQEWAIFDGGFNDIWGRMGHNVDGTWDGYGIRARIGALSISISAFINFTEHVLGQYGALNIQTWVPPTPGEKYSLICGTDNTPAGLRTFRLLRDGAKVLTAKEAGTGSLINSAHRGIGFGMRAGAALLTQATPSNVRKISAGDNGAATQTGFLSRVNAGDQEAWDRFTLTGPGTFQMYDGPGATDYVEFGPILAGQTVQIRTDPRKYSVKDLSSEPAAPAQVNQQKKALDDLIDFLTLRNVNILTDIYKSVLGIFGGGAPVPVQGNLYKLLKGRFSVAIPAKSPGRPCVEYLRKVTIVNGNADSSVLVALTPLRRNPY